MQGNVNIPDSTITTNLSFRQLVLMNMQQLTNFPYIEKDFDALTDYELLCLVVKYLNDVIDNQNEQNDSITRMYESFLALQDYVNNTKDELEDAFNSLDDYVRNYFDNLDVQEEINNKLDDMLEDGVLEQIIEQFLQLTSLICFDNVADMKSSVNLANGSYAKTLGYYNVNDGGEATYKIRTITNEDIVDEMLIIALNDNNLIAELIYDNEINVLQVGLDNTNTNDNSTKLQSLINKVDNITLFFPVGTYKFTQEINMINKSIYLKGNFNHVYGNTNQGLIFDGVNGFINTGRIYIEQLIIQEKELAHTSRGIKVSSGTRIKKCTIIGFNVAISCEYKPVVIEDCNLHYNNSGITNPVDSRIINNTINANEIYGIMLQAGANDNIIDSNKIEWNKKYHILMYQCVHNVISNNIFDRSTEQALRMGEVTTTTITGNLFRRNNIATTVSDNNCQVRMESCHNIVFSSNQLLTGNSNDDGTGDVVPQYAMYILTSYDILSIGNSYVNSSVQSDHIKLYNNAGNIQFLDMNFDISSYLKGSNYTISLTSSTPVTLSVPGKPSDSNGYPILSKFNYLIRRVDTGAYEAGEIDLCNFRLWNSATSTSAKMSISSFVNGDITSTITFNRDTNNYDIVFTSASNSYGIRFVPIYI